MTRINGLNKRDFTSYWNRMVKKEYKVTSLYPLKDEPWNDFQSEFINTGNIEISGEYTKSGNPVIYC